ncbi:Cyclic nucleotide-binding protein [Pseudocohnilembus persalinus]|uniref:Cyclic nucleotide-binding protein n=1 Tax=Pseudocohnilembus persalinus TaxID=266149 RepID=A0A0V0R0C5_PSEPJ|nr:Cyclic nucleotide-binding protein [Pseudocohnilembus persalinus]|eukprot:KRX07760.1 Cyclic nucleotide-binding protein [Pseudocohnilembus persalinus]
MSENEYIQQFKQNYNMVKLYQPGEAFGELALLTKAKRAATMECKTDICLIQMSKQGFDLIVGSYLKFMNNQRIQFLRQFCFFNKVHYNQLSRCIHMLEEVKFIKNNVIFKENEEAQYLYLIKSGQIEISKQIDIEEQNTSIKNQQLVQTQAKDNITKMLKKVKKVKQIGLFYLGINQDFGALEIVENRLTQVQATCCSESATIFRIKKDQFMQFMKQQDKENLEILKQACKQSQEQIEKRIEQVIQGYAKISQFFTQSLYKDEAQKKFMIYQSITDQQRIDSPNYQNRFFTPKINKQSNFNSSRHIYENQENLVQQQNQYILKKGYNKQKKLKTTSSFNITELKGHKKSQDFQSFNYPESDKIRKNLSYIKSSAEQSYSPSRKVKTDVNDYCDNDEFNSIYQNLDQKKSQKNNNQKQIQQNQLNNMDTSIQLQKGKSKFKSYQQQQQQMEEQNKLGSQKEIYQYQDKTNQLSQRFISSKKEKNYKNMDLEKETKIQKFSKKTYQNGIQEQTNTKQDILNYLNKKKENLSLIYEHEALNDLHFQRLLLLQLKNYDIKMNKKEIDQTLEQFNQNQKQEFNQIQQEKNPNYSQDKNSSSNQQLGKPKQQLLARQEYFNSRLPVKIQDNKSNQDLLSSNSIKSSRNLKKITHKKDIERTSIYLENEANKDFNNDKKNFDLNQSYKSQDKSGSEYKSEYSSLNFPQQDKILVKNSTSNFYLQQKQKIIDDRDKYIHNMVNPQDNLYTQNQQEIYKNIENKNDQYFPTLYDKKQSQSLDHLQLVKRMISKRSMSKKQQSDLNQFSFPLEMSLLQNQQQEQNEGYNLNSNLNINKSSSNKQFNYVVQGSYQVDQNQGLKKGKDRNLFQMENSKENYISQQNQLQVNKDTKSDNLNDIQSNNKEGNLSNKKPQSSVQQDQNEKKQKKLQQIQKEQQIQGGNLQKIGNKKIENQNLQQNSPKQQIKKQQLENEKIDNNLQVPFMEQQEKQNIQLIDDSKQNIKQSKTVNLKGIQKHRVCKQSLIPTSQMLVQKCKKKNALASLS